VNRAQKLRELLKDRILVLDGAMGTELQRRGLKAQDFGGESFEGCNEYLNFTRPDVVLDIHRGYLRAGADIIETNTFGSTPLVLAEYGLHEKAYEISRRGAELARQAAAAFETPDRPRFVAGSMGPTTKSLSVTGGVTFDELVEHYYVQAAGLVDGGADYLLIETAQDTRNIKAALIAIGRLEEERKSKIAVAVSGTIEAMGTMLAGQTAEALVTSLEHADLLYLGLNCATGPEFMADHIRVIAESASVPVACVPNAGLPDDEGRYVETPEMMARVLARFIERGWVNLIGGCCGTTPAHIEVFARLAEGRAPRVPVRRRGTFVSGIENLEIEETNRPVIVGERTNVIGSRKFRELIAQEKYDEASEIARAQVKGGAQIVDICLANPDRDESRDMEAFLDHVIKKVKVPLMIDSTDPAVIERALTYCQGKAIINSINLEDGEERFERVVPLARKFGAAFVVGTIDEDKKQGMAVTRERKLEIAKRSYDLLVNKYGVPPSDIIFDPLTFPCATGDAQYIGSAVETIEGIRLIKQAMPETKTILGISNVSFGLPPAGREVLNSVFLYHCTQAGLDMAIVNSEKLERYASIPDEEKRLAERLLFDTSEESIAAFVEHFRGQESRLGKKKSDLSLDERLAQYIIEGTRDGLIEDLAEKLKEASPMEIINGPLMAGMDEVGRLFNNNELIVAEVLQSAEAMKAAVAYLEQFMDKADVASRGKVLLATVKGDVHDIGKNLVDIVLSNNGYEVINLGIKVPPSDLIQAIREYKPDIVGLSGLLVKSAQQMVVTAEELTAAGTCPPMLVGGAALSNSFTRRKIAPAYANLVAYADDAMKGLELANQIMDPQKRAELEARLKEESAALGALGDRSREAFEPGEVRSASVPILERVPNPPDFDRHVLRHINLDEVWAYINPAMLYSRHLGLRGGRAEALLAEGDPKAMMLKELIDELKEVCRAGAMEVHAVWRFFPAYSEGNTLFLADPETGDVLAQLTFPRQPKPDGLCLADFANPKGVAPLGGVDNVCLFAVTAGKGIRELYESYKAKGEFLKSHAIQALAIETAEGCAEWLHSKIRGWWGFPDDPDMTMKERFQARYRGRRYSFGYPACPDLSMQRVLFDLIRPEEIGIELTEEFMMEPEASVSALVFHHPACEYFSVGKENL